tara:strand:+ start:588 stop:1199 length:612 start_codon:yes stop_codon:yes gene_type:complete
MNYNDDIVIPQQIKQRLIDVEYTPQKMKEIEYDSMGDDDIRDYFPNIKIITYPELKNYNAIEQILPHDKSHCIVLYLQTPSSGHWSMLSKNNNCIEFFCSYGSSPSTPLKWTPESVRIKLNQNVPYLDILLSKTKERVIYNPIDYQNNRDLKVSTCGRHCCLRLTTILKYNMPLNDYYEMMKKIKTTMNMTYDEIVSEYIDKI